MSPSFSLVSKLVFHRASNLLGPVETDSSEEEEGEEAAGSVEGLDAAPTTRGSGRTAAVVIPSKKTSPVKNVGPSSRQLASKADMIRRVQYLDGFRVHFLPAPPPLGAWYLVRLSATFSFTCLYSTGRGQVHEVPCEGMGLLRSRRAYGRPEVLELPTRRAALPLRRTVRPPGHR